MRDPVAEQRLDAVLIARALQNDERNAFGQLVRRYQGTVRAQLRRLTRGDHGWADDLAQEAFLQAWRKLGQFRGQARFSTWLYRIVYLTFLQSARSRPQETPYIPAEHNDGGHDDSHRLALRADLSKAMEQLSEAEQAALAVCYTFDLTHVEAAFVLGMPAGTIKTHLARGKAKLKDSLAVWNPSNG